MTASGTIRQEVEICKYEARRIAIEVIRQVLDLPDGSYIKDKELMMAFDENGGGHSWIAHKKYRHACRGDEEGLYVIKTIQESK